jgi:glycosyltransferase involved in cell wall biosynthesis
MERSVIETFDLLRPEVAPHFLIQRSNDRYDTALLRELKKRNFSLSFFSDTWDWPRLGKPHSFVDLVKMLWCLVVANCDVFRACLRNDVIYLPVFSSAYLAFVSCLYYRLLNRKVIYFFHDVASKPSLKLMPAVWGSSDLVHCAERSRQMARSANPRIEDRINHVIPPCIEIRSSGTLDLSRWQSKRIILFVGQVSAHKGLDLLAEAFLSLRGRYQDVALHIVGGCQAQFPPWFERLLGAAVGVDVKYWGYVDNVHDLFRAAYIYVHPSPPSRFHESFGRGVVEAMALGIPAVCFKSGPLDEIVVHERTGLVCEQESAACLAENLSRMLDDAHFRAACSERAIQRYDECYSNGPIRAAWLQLLCSRRGL